MLNCINPTALHSALSKQALVLATVCTGLVFGISAHSEELTTQALYERFNMRSIYSSYGQRLKYYCESYPKDFFTIESQTEGALELRAGDDVWIFYLLGGNKVSIHNQITSGTYLSAETYELKFEPESQDWRTSETFNPIPEDCVEYTPNLGQLNVRAKISKHFVNGHTTIN